VAWSLLAVERNRVWANDKALWEDTISASPDSIKAYGNLGTIYFNEGNYELAFDLFERLKEVDPSSVTYDYYMALRLFNAGKFTDTINVLRKALKIDNDSINVNALIAQSYEITGSRDKAMENYINVLRSNELDTEGRKEYAQKRLSVLRASISPELDRMRKMVRAEPSDLNARVNLALALDRAGLYDEAIENYLELESLGGANWMLFYNMANTYKKKLEYENALKYYMKSLSLNNRNSLAYNNLGLVLKKLGEYDRAEEAFINAIEADNDYSHPPFNLAILYFHMGDYDNAVKYFNYVRERFADLKEQTHPYLEKLDRN
jgi:tetratricopeptide (TPR) repeat protein